MTQTKKRVGAEEQAFRDYFGPRLKAAMEYRGMTQKRLAQILDTDQATISAWWHGHNTILGYRITQIARALNVTADSLLGLAEGWDERWNPASSDSPAEDALPAGELEDASRTPRQRRRGAS